MKLILIGTFLFYQAIAWANSNAPEANDMNTSEINFDGNAHQFDFLTIDGEPLPLSSFSGKALLVVNTASRCGFTSQYSGLQSLWEKYKDQGLVILGVPSNDFMGQEPGTESEIKTFCSVNFNVDFPMTSKVRVKGKNAHPFYSWIKKKSGSPRWNFHKYLLDHEGNFVIAYSSITDPLSDKLVEVIESTLDANKNFN
ncbi:MAG: glutathione peroxidase [Porticoccus sp.]|jgi:glutathione peroxidase|nr:glutathione peroxidase [Porticoccus sp.]|tara:strand:- start:748 stop:1341 length:594 start_codon:yes stop_codon:yes gene_type:complete